MHLFRYYGAKQNKKLKTACILGASLNTGTPYRSIPIQGYPYIGHLELVTSVKLFKSRSNKRGHRQVELASSAKPPNNSRSKNKRPQPPDANHFRSQQWFFLIVQQDIVVNETSCAK